MYIKLIFYIFCKYFCIRYFYNGSICHYICFGPRRHTYLQQNIIIVVVTNLMNNILRPNLPVLVSYAVLPLYLYVLIIQTHKHKTTTTTKMTVYKLFHPSIHQPFYIEQYLYNYYIILYEQNSVVSY